MHCFIQGGIELESELMTYLMRQPYIAVIETALQKYGFTLTPDFEGFDELMNGVTDYCYALEGKSQFLSIITRKLFYCPYTIFQKLPFSKSLFSETP